MDITFTPKIYSSDEIRDILEEYGLSQAWLAEKCHMTRATANYILMGHTSYQRVKSERSIDRGLLLMTYVLDDFISTVEAYEKEVKEGA